MRLVVRVGWNWCLYQKEANPNSTMPPAKRRRGHTWRWLWRRCRKRCCLWSTRFLGFFSHSFLHMFKKMLHGSKSWTLFENLFENFFCISWITLMLILRLAWLLRTLSRPMRKTFIRQHEFIEFRVAISKANKLSSHFVNIFWRSIFSIGPSLLNLKEYPILNPKSHPHVRCKQTLYAESKITTL